MIATLQRCIDLTRSLTRAIKVADTLREDMEAARDGWVRESRARDEAVERAARACDGLVAVRGDLRRALAERDQTCEAWRAENEIAIQERDQARKSDADARSCLNTVIENGRATVEALRLAERERDEARTLLGATRAQLAEVENREAARRVAFFTPFAPMPDESRPFLDKAIKRISELEEGEDALIASRGRAYSERDEAREALRDAEQERDEAKDDRDHALQAKLRAEQKRDEYSAEFASAYWLCKADQSRLIPDTLSGVADVYGRPVAEYIRRSAGPDYDNGRVTRATAICVAIQALPVAERFPVVGRFQSIGALAGALPVASDEAEAALARLDPVRESRPIVDESEAAAAYLEREADDVAATYGRHDPTAGALRLRAKRIREGAHRVSK